MPYTVFVDDNAHYMDESERYKLGEYETATVAVAAARRLVDDDLASLYTPGMSADDLYRHYTAFGVDPFVVPADDDSAFSAWAYARTRCDEICQQTPQSD